MFTLLCYFAVCIILLIIVLEYLSGTVKAFHLYNLYYRKAETPNEYVFY